MPHNTKEIRHAYNSKYNLKHGGQVILLMITDDEKWHYLALKNLSALYRGIRGNNNGDFYCLNCFTHILQKTNLENVKTCVKIMIIAMEKCLKKIIKY